MGVAEGFCLPAIFQHFAQRLTESQRSSAFGVMLASGSVGQLAALLTESAELAGLLDGGA